MIGETSNKNYGNQREKHQDKTFCDNLVLNQIGFSKKGE
jgi:hypothetical protein